MEDEPLGHYETKPNTITDKKRALLGHTYRRKTDYSGYRSLKGVHKEFDPVYMSGSNLTGGLIILFTTPNPKTWSKKLT